MEEMDTATAKTGELKRRRRKGATKQVLGCVILFAGLLDILMAFKGGSRPDPFNYVMLLSGAVILALGTAQSRQA